MLQDLSRLIIGEDPMRVDAIWEKLFKVSFWGQGGGPVVFAAISAIDIALMDIKGKALNVPIYELLGGKFRDNDRCYASQLQFGWNDRIGPWGSKEEYAAI
ncbi:MAG: mandelate racemase/muconate lactonizing enzyme family protein, partial [Oscillospiraceae bacterium]|nr:mandelate racemase/muconate lactonizing enzyme family protein [Oscillospiraceae bacterium]